MMSATLKQRTAVVILCLLAVPCLAQGVRSPILQIPLDGQWEEKPAWTAGQEANAKYAFYERNSATVLHIQRLEKAMQPGSLDDVVSAMQKEEATSTGTRYLAFAQLLARGQFSRPAVYMRALRVTVDKVMAGGNERMPRMRDVKDIEANAQWFYVSQLNPGMVAHIAGTSLMLDEDYIPMKMTRAERYTAVGEALVFEMETQQPAIVEDVHHFQMPRSVEGQKIRYGMIFYARSGFAAGEPPISVVFATPVNSGVDCKSILNALSQTKPQTKP
jgi:hypothetical protein